MGAQGHEPREEWQRGPAPGQTGSHRTGPASSPPIPFMPAPHPVWPPALQGDREPTPPHPPVVRQEPCTSDCRHLERPSLLLLLLLLREVIVYWGWAGGIRGLVLMITLTPTSTSTARDRAADSKGSLAQVHNVPMATVALAGRTMRAGGEPSAAKMGWPRDILGSGAVQNLFHLPFVSV